MRDEIVVSGSLKTVMDQPAQVVDRRGALGGFLVTKKDWDDPAIPKHSFTVLAEAVPPELRDYVSAKAAHADDV